MSTFLHSRYFYISLAIGVIAFVVFLLINIVNRNAEPLTTTTVERGSVRELVSVSGIAEAEQTAELAFPVTGIIETVHVQTGDIVQPGDQLISLNRAALEADRQDALAAIAKARADRDELLEGPTESARDVSDLNVVTQEQALANIIETENQKVLNSYRALLSSDITAYSEKNNEVARPPVISGTYSCDEEGSYLIETYSSNSDSGYSFRLSGLENGTFVASTDQPIRLGECGLRIQFDNDSRYNRTEWVIDIPNIASPQYVLNRNAYSLALTQRESSISAAKQALEIARANLNNQNAPARSQSLARANASIQQAEARLARIDSTISERTLRAPFTGTITEINVLPGETVSTAPVITLLANSEFEVTARIPEIDIGKLEEGQKVEMLFDARAGEIVTGEIKFISLRSTIINGVSYFEAIISLDELPSWVRSGLNADVDIIIREELEVLRIPKRFLVDNNGPALLLGTRDSRNNFRTVTTTMEIIMEGNDGYAAITGLNEGDIVVAP